MLMTPPDMISQTLLAIPIWLLFELGLLLSRVAQRKKARNEQDDKPNYPVPTQTEIEDKIARIEDKRNDEK